MFDKFEKLKNEWLHASEERRAEIDKELDEMASENPTEFANAYEKSLENTVECINNAVLRSQLKEVEDAVSFSYIAKVYFGKSKEWFYQRLNGYNVNGKPAKFTDEELKTLNGALQELSNKIGAVHLNY